MALLVLSKRQPDLLASETAIDDPLPVVSSLSTAEKKVEAPTASNNVVPHELCTAGSRAMPKVADFIEHQRLLGGTACTEQRILELNAARQINRGPPGVFASSNLHWDVLTGRDGRVSYGDFLNYYDKL